MAQLEDHFDPIRVGCDLPYVVSLICFGDFDSQTRLKDLFGLSVIFCISVKLNTFPLK